MPPRTDSDRPRSAPSPRKRINLGLQGGAMHGAFTWGVLDRLLADDRIEIEAVSGASAGALNAAVLAQGLLNGSREEARATLRLFWERLAKLFSASPLGLASRFTGPGHWGLKNSPIYLAFEIASRLTSPYQFNPLNINPLRTLLNDTLEFDRLRQQSALKLFISATNVETGRPRVFRSAELRADHLLASSCVPMAFQAVEIDGKYYWDGGYMGNPPLWPLFDHAASTDVVIVQIDPFYRKGPPKNGADILERMTEIMFNASLMHELRMVDFVTRLIEDGRLSHTGYRHIFVHMIGDKDLFWPLGATSKLNTSHAFMEMLFKGGVAAADRWLAAHFDDLGHKSSLDLRAIFQTGDTDPAHTALYRASEPAT